MRTLTFIVVGLLLVAFAMWLAKPEKRRGVAVVFTLGWLLAVAWNLRTGMSHGYTFPEELPIQVVIFAIPVVGAWLLARKRRRR